MSRFKGGNPDEMIAAAKVAKAFCENNGAEYFHFSRFYTGPWTGEWLLVIRCKDWAAYSKFVDARSKDAEYQKLAAHVMSISQLMSRNITVGVDL